MSNYTTVSLTYKVGEPQILNRGQYLEAEIEVKNGLTKKEQSKVIKSLQVIQEPQYEQGTCNVNLLKPFIENALERPSKPGRKASQEEFDLFRNWNKMTDRAKIAVAVKKYVKEMGGFDPQFEIL